FADDRVVVGQLFTLADVAAGAGPDRLVDHLEPAVRGARVVDEPRDVAADVRVAAPVAVDAEHPDAALGEIPLLALLALAVVDQFAGVVDDPRVLPDPLPREHAVAVHCRLAANDLRQLLLTFHINLGTLKGCPYDSSVVGRPFRGRHAVVAYADARARFTPRRAAARRAADPDLLGRRRLDGERHS